MPPEVTDWQGERSGGDLKGTCTQSAMKLNAPSKLVHAAMQQVRITGESE